MYLETAIKRINSIDWKRLGNSENKDDKNLGYEYLRGMAIFFRDQSLIPTNPLFTNVASLLGDKEIIDIVNYCDTKAQEALRDKSLPKTIIMFYLQLAKYSDQTQNGVELYIHIYDPLIQLLEEGFIYAFKEGGLMIYNAKFYPLTNWYKNFL